MDRDIQEIMKDTALWIRELEKRVERLEKSRIEFPASYTARCCVCGDEVWVCMVRIEKGVTREFCGSCWADMLERGD